jgi:DNA polymerase elongation subunit (family B)
MNKILPLAQQFTDHNSVYVGGWVKSTPGKHKWVVSFDFSSLYPSNIRFLNIGVDTLIKEEELPQELRDLRDTYFTYYTQKNLSIIQASNNNQEELNFFKSLIDNKDNITPILKKYNVTISPNGYFFDKGKESIFAGLMGSIYANRKIEQKELKKYQKEAETNNSEEVQQKITLHDTMQYSLKILMNSAYGSTALDYNPFSFGKGMAASITTVGRFANRWVAYHVNNKIASLDKSKKNLEKVPYTIQADTDSNYFDFSSLIAMKFPNGVPSAEIGISTCNTIADKLIVPTINKATTEIAELLNAYNPSVLDMEMETITDSFISVADKRYYCRYYKQGKEKYKITGLSLIGKSTPAWCKTKLQPILGIIADTTSKEVINYIEDVKRQFTSSELKDICVIKGVSSINYFQEPDTGKFYQFNLETGRKNPAPFHSRGSIVHNMILEQANDTKHTPIKGGDKVYILPLIVPNNCFNQNVVCFINPAFITDYGIDKYVDYDTMFEKNFKKNIELITEPIGWSLNAYQGVLDDWE